MELQVEDGGVWSRAFRGRGMALIMEAKERLSKSLICDLVEFATTEKSRREGQMVVVENIHLEAEGSGSLMQL